MTDKGILLDKDNKKWIIELLKTRFQIIQSFVTAKNISSQQYCHVSILKKNKVFFFHFRFVLLFFFFLQKDIVQINLKGHVTITIFSMWCATFYFGTEDNKVGESNTTNKMKVNVAN